jgi:hypothetical protein
MLLFALPFNISIAFPSLVDPYVTGVYVNYLVPTVSILDVFALLLLASLISQHRNLTDFLTRIPLPIYLLAGYFLLHSLLHPDLNVIFSSGRLLLYTLTAYHGVKEVIKSKQDFGADILKILFVSVMIQLVIGVLQFSGGKSLGLEFLGESKLLAGAIGTSFIKLSEGEFLRAYGTFPHPNVLAGYLLFAFLSASFTHFTYKKKGLPLLLMLLSSFLMVFTFSRVALALMVISWLVIGYISLMKKGLAVLIFERFGTFFTGMDYALEDRVKLIRESIEIIKQNLWFGVGSGSFTRALGGNVPYAATGISLLQPVHNIPLLLISEHGIIFGLLLTGLITVLILRPFFLSLGGKHIFILGSLSILAVGLMDHYLTTIQQGEILLLGGLFLLNPDLSKLKTTSLSTSP